MRKPLLQRRFRVSIEANFACMYRMSHYHRSNSIFLPFLSRSSLLLHLLSNHLIANQTFRCFEQTKSCPYLTKPQLLGCVFKRAVFLENAACIESIRISHFDFVESLIKHLPSSFLQICLYSPHHSICLLNAFAVPGDWKQCRQTLHTTRCVPASCPRIHTAPVRLGRLMRLKIATMASRL